MQFVLRINLHLGIIVRGALAIGGAHHDLLVQGLEPPAVGDEFTGQPIEQLRVRWQLALQAEVIGRVHDAAAEMMLPKAVDDHAREQMTSSVLGVSDPVGQRPPPITGAPTLGRRNLPRLFRLAAAHQHLQETLRGFPVLLIGVAALKEIGLLVKVWKAAAIGMVFGGFEALAGDLHLFHLRLRLGGEMLLHLGVELVPLCVLRAVNLQQLRTLFGIQLIDIAGLFHRSEQRGQRGSAGIALDGHRLGRGCHRQTRAADGVTGVYKEIHLDGQHSATLKSNRRGKLKHRRLRLADAAEVHRPTRLALVTINRASHGEAAGVLLVCRLGIHQLHRQALAALLRRCEHANVAQRKVAVGCPAGPITFHRLISQCLDADGVKASGNQFGGEHPAIVGGVFAADNE